MSVDKIDRIDIHRLTVDAPVKEDNYLSQLENLAEDAWRNLRPSLQARGKENASFMYATDEIIDLSTLFPQRCDKLREIFTNEDLEILGINATTKTIFGSFSDEKVIIAARKLQTLFPQRFKKLNFDREQITRRAKDLIQPVEDGEYRGIKWAVLAGYKIIFPEIDLPAFNTVEVWKALEMAYIESTLFRPEIAGSLRIIFPEQFNASNIEEDLYKKEMEDMILAASNGDWIGIANNSYYLKILLAKELKFTPEGLELIMPEQKTTDIGIPALPETKKY